MANASQFIGSKISLISKSEIRYEGILYALDVREATISLAKVKSFGTEDRPTERPVPPKEEIYEFIIFRGSDIKGIDVVEPPQAPPTQAPDGFPNDPAIVEVSHYSRSSNQNQGFGNASGSAPGSNFGNTGFPSAGQHKPSESGLPMSSNPVLDDSGELSLPQFDSPTNVQQETSRSNNSTPTAFNSRKSPSVDAGTQANQGRRDRGPGPSQYNGPQQRYNNVSGGGRGQSSSGGMQRGGRQQNNYQPRGRGSYDRPPQRGGNQYQQRGYQHQQRGGYQNQYHRGPPRAQGILQAPATAKVTFDAPFDFEKANEELLTAIKDLKVTDEKKAENEASEDSQTVTEKSDEQENKEPTTYYKKDNFFDSISCEALERTKGQGNRVDWRAERKLNAETFGLPNRGGRGGGYYNRNYNRGGYYGGNRGNFRDGNNFRGGRGGGGYGYNNRQGSGERRNLAF